MTRHSSKDDGAPRAAALLRDFINTAEPQTATEDLDGPPALAAWSAAHGLVRAGATVRPDDVRVVVVVREGLRAVLQAHAGHDAPPDDVAALTAALAEVPVRAGFDSSGELRLGAGDERAVTSLVAGLLEAVREAGEDGSWPRLKVCARDSCRWAFYDGSRNRSARWCSMAGCGNQVKMQRAHARRRGAANGG